jgi:hypothetical protein
MKKLLPSLALVVLVLLPGAARADGLPLPVDESNSGVLTADGEIRFLTASARGRTAVLSQSAAHGSVMGADLLPGRFTVPLVSYDGTAAGLSGDERTLVLIRPRASFPRRRTSFAVLDAASGRLRLRRLVHLRGDFSFDALSPDGRSLFLINYVSRRDPRRYRVRVYDLARGRLAPKPIVDPREDPDEMNGVPYSRATSSDGRWAYTLYDGMHGHPFIHALDTVARKAVCIDLDDVRGDPFRMRLEVDATGDTLTVVQGRRSVAVVDTATFEVRDPEGAADAARPLDKDDGAPWTLAAGGLALLGGGLLAARARGRAR